MKRYDVSEDDLENLIDMAREYGREPLHINALCLSQAYAACTKVEIDPGIEAKLRAAEELAAAAVEAQGMGRLSHD